MAEEKNLYIAIFQNAINDDTTKGIEVVSSTYKLSSNALLVESEVAKASVLSDLLEIGDDLDPPRIGVVFKLNGSYSGFYAKDLWSWLEEIQERIIG